MLDIKHNAGFFSCCSVRICKIINYFSKYKILPSLVNCSSMFSMYKIDKNTDITYDFFEHYDNINDEIVYEKDIPINIYNFQFSNYKNVDYKSLIPFVNKYFTPTPNIEYISTNLKLKYNIDVNACIGLYYRGTDKCVETKIDSYDSYYNKLIELTNKEPNLQILIQTDTAQFINYMNEKQINNVIVISENSTSYTNRGIHKEKTPSDNYNDVQTLFATFLIISKCKYIICSSGNCSIWMMYYRENANNVFQNLNKVWL
jgi:hypothetical protein